MTIISFLYSSKLVLQSCAATSDYRKGCKATSEAAAAESCNCFKAAIIKRSENGGCYAAIIYPPCRFSPDQQLAAAGRQWQPLFERSEFVGCHSPAAVSCPGRNAAGEFFLCELSFLRKKRKWESGKKESKSPLPKKTKVERT
ncbi:MAG: hypothetical protein PHV66_05140 [Bacteroidales bacterium]|nr:hypothetical protein [Bacteroidales bacterium]